MADDISSIFHVLSEGLFKHLHSLFEFFCRKLYVNRLLCFSLLSSLPRVELISLLPPAAPCVDAAAEEGGAVAVGYGIF